MKKQTFLKGSVILMASAVAAKLLGALFRIPLTNMLGGVGMSCFSCAYSLFMPVYALIVTGISSAVARMTASSAALGMYANTRRIRRVALIIFTAAGLPAGALMAALAVPFSVYSVGSTDAAAAVAMIAPAVVFSCITAVERGYYEGLSNMYPTAVSQVVEGIVKASAGLWLCGYVTENGEQLAGYFPWIGDVRALAAAAGILGVTLSTVGAALYFAVLRLFTKPPENAEKALESRREIARQLVREALPVGAGAVVTNLSALIDMWTIIGLISRSGAYTGRFEGVADGEVPQFVYGSFSGIALTVFNLVPSVTNMLGKGALTCIASAKGCGSPEALRRSSTQALLTAAVIAVPAAVGLGVMAPEVLELLFSRQSDEVGVCISSLRLLMPAMLCLCMSYPLFSMLQAVGRASAPLKIMLAGTAVKLVGNLLLIPFIGVDGAAVSTSVSYAFILAASLRCYFRETGAVPDKLPFLGVLYAGAMCGGAAYVAEDFFGESPAARLAAAAIAGGGVYFAVLWTVLGRKAFALRKSSFNKK